MILNVSFPHEPDSIISNCFPDITKAQVYECLAYYEDRRGEIDLLIARQMATRE